MEEGARDYLQLRGIPSSQGRVDQPDNETTISENSLKPASHNKVNNPTAAAASARCDVNVDGGWAWVVLLGACVTMFIVSLWYTGGLFNIIFLEEFRMNKQATSWLTAVQSSVASWIGIVSSLLINKIGLRWTTMLGAIVGTAGYLLTYLANSFAFVFVSFALLVGSGLGICYVPCIVVTSLYFHKYRNLCIGLISASFAAGTMLLPLLITKTQEYFGWRGCMLILSGLFMQILISGAIFRPKLIVIDDINLDETENGHHEENIGINDNENIRNNQKQSSDKLSPDVCGRPLITSSTTKCDEIRITNVTGVGNDNNSNKSKKHFLRNSGFLLICANFFSVSSALFIVYIHFPAYFVEQGSTDSDISTCFLILGVANILCRLTGGIATNSEDIDPLLVYMCACGLSTVVIFLCPLMAASHVGRLVFSGLYGFHANCVYSLLGPVTIQLVGLENLSWAYGLEHLCGGIGGLIGPPLAGWLYDVSGTYTHSFYLAGASYLLSTLLVMLVPIFDTKNQMSPPSTSSHGSKAEPEASNKHSVLLQNTSCDTVEHT